MKSGQGRSRPFYVEESMFGTATFLDPSPCNRTGVIYFSNGITTPDQFNTALLKDGNSLIYCALNVSAYDVDATQKRADGIVTETTRKMDHWRSNPIPAQSDRVILRTQHVRDRTQ